MLVSDVSMNLNLLQYEMAYSVYSGFEEKLFHHDWAKSNGYSELGWKRSKVFMKQG